MILLYMPTSIGFSWLQSGAGFRPSTVWEKYSCWQCPPEQGVVDYPNPPPNPTIPWTERALRIRPRNCMASSSMSSVFLGIWMQSASHAANGSGDILERQELAPSNGHVGQRACSRGNKCGPSWRASLSIYF